MITGKNFEVIDYASDVKIKAYGRTMEELFENSARGMFFLISENDASDLKVIQKISISTKHKVTCEELLVFWLERLLFYVACSLWKHIVIPPFSPAFSDKPTFWFFGFRGTYRK